MSDKPENVREIVDNLGKLKSESGEVRLEQVIETFGSRSYGPLILVPALLGSSPLGTVPSVPSFLALVIALVAVQILMGRTHFWLPQFIANRSVSQEKLEKATNALSGPAGFMDRVFHGRLKWATREPMSRVAAGMVLMLSVLVVPLELVPLAAIIPFSGIAAFGLAMTVRDGALMLLAIALWCASLGVAVMAWTG